MTVWKFQLPKVGENRVDMPRGAEVLSAGQQDGDLFIWAMVDGDQPTETRIIDAAWTGNNLVPCINRRFIGSVQIRSLMFHVFELKQ